MESKQIVTAEPLVGYRCWFVFAVNGRWWLHSLAYGGWWEPSKPVHAMNLKDSNYGDEPKTWKTCIPKQNRRDNLVGIWAFKKPTQIDLACHVAGEVWLWGNICEHTLGYRAEYAYPKCLYKHSGSHHFSPGFEQCEDSALKYLAETYGVPIVDGTWPSSPRWFPDLPSVKKPISPAEVRTTVS